MTMTSYNLQLERAQFLVCILSLISFILLALDSLFPERSFGAYIDLKSANMQPLINRLSSELQSDAVFQYIIDQVKRDPERAIRIGGTFLYNITKDGKQMKQWTMDLKNAYVYEGAPKDNKPNTTLTISDEDFLLMSQGKLNPQVAFMKGKLKVTGNLMMAQKLAPLLKTTAKL